MVSDLLMSYSEGVNQTLRRENKIDMSHENDEAHLNDRRRGKFIAFAISEALALGFLLPSLAFGLLRRASDPTLALSMNVVTITAAAAVAIIPIIFYAIVPTIPRSER
jgi:hypothetical protein